MDLPLRADVKGYLVAIAGIAVIAMVRLTFREELGTGIPLIPFVIPVVWAGWIGGALPALFATALSCAVGVALLMPTTASAQLVETLDSVRVAMFIAFGLAASALFEQFRRARTLSLAHAERVRENEERLRLALDAANVGSWEWKLKTDEMFWSPETYALLGIPPSRAATRELFESVFEAEERARHRNAIEEALATGHYECDLRLPHPDGPPGAYRYLSARGRVLKDERGREERLLGVAGDVTERRRAEESLLEADRRKDEFLAMLAHELRNPLAPIRNAVHVQKLRAPLDPELVWSRDVIDRQVQQMGRLLDDLLDVSRISRNKLALRLERVTLADVIASAIETSRPGIKDAGHELALRLPESHVWLDADPTRLSQVFSNLLNNAAKFMPEGGHIFVTAERQGRVIEVRVRDRGAGIPPELLPRIFDTFTQATPASAFSREGLGIGLSLARGLVELHGGTIEAQSAGLGCGAELIVRLPVASAPRSIERPPVFSLSSVKGPSRRVLVADDVDDSAESLALVLRRMGHEVEVARDGESAIEAVRSFAPDVVLLDIGMPRVDGYEVCRRLRAEPGGKSLHLIAITGWGQEEDRRRSQEAGFDRHLVKPVDPAELAALIAWSD
jgi:PAS domain S-box-containing protein